MRLTGFVAALAPSLLLASCTSGTGIEATPPPKKFFPSDDQITALIEPALQNGEIKGVVVGLIENDGSRRVLAYGDAGTCARMLDGRSAFEIGSINKTFTGAVLADMVRRGEVSLDDPVARHLPPNVKVPQRNGRQITLLDLATHRSGLPRLPTRYTPPDKTNPYAHFAAEDLYKFLSSHELQRDPGAEPLYSNLGMGLLGHALSRAAGAASFQELLEQRILQPLGMKATRFGRPPSLLPFMTKGHDEKGAQVPYWDVAVLAGAGGLSSTANDMLTYLDANIGPARSGIERSMRDAHLTRRDTPSPGLRIGLGWTTRERVDQKVVSHEGGTAGYSSYIGFDPVRQVGVVILANSHDFDDINVIGLKLLADEAASQTPPR